MFTKVTQWIEENDPYYIQRIIFHKTLYGVVIMAFANWIFKPVSFYALFFTGILAANIHMGSMFKTNKQKEHAIFLPYITVIIFGTVLYLAFPFKIYFIMGVLSIFVLLHVLTYFYLNIYKPFVPLLLNCILLINNSAPQEGSLQTVINFCSAMLLSLFLALFIYKTFPNKYHFVVHRALIIYLKVLRQKVDNLINSKQESLYPSALMNIEVVQNHIHLVKRSLKKSYYRIFLFTRNIFMMLAVIPIQQDNSTNQELLKIRELLDNTIYALKNKIALNDIDFAINTNSKPILYIYKNIHRISSSWNFVCKK